ncbi:Gx transporter family protein [Magnetofaba australis]|uniref:Putative heptaprenyl diphosphate synthase component I n=1 Tax=Magnetofaba australis IT-1 TaxID=1434232 RepID=A0A1Y2K010_9PROT|nr:Gx transporter family protein [Magnetofaba australis]OSM01373.1 putative heptaprenyl diphosphate synthase component I [Magnetofaba australis IT-1]
MTRPLAHVDSEPLHPLRRDLLAAWLTAAAIAAHVAESALPGLGPWFKPGVANLFVVATLFHLGWRLAVTVALIRVFVGAFVLGTFLSPTFFLSLGGALAAVAAMGLAMAAHRLPGCGSPSRQLGPVGVSILMALAHMGAQVVIANLLLVRHDGLYLALPGFLFSAWITGLFNGVLAFLLIERLRRH